MKFAYVDNNKLEATPGSRGYCRSCESELIAKCGDLKVWHWAHKGRRTCDPWWENETKWHRDWKDKFPTEWQEVIQHDNSTGEKHIADVRTENGLVVEFQHSYLKREERDARESFYKNMVWVVDGTRLKRDYPRFQRGMEDFTPILKQGFFLTYFPEECFPRNWLDSTVPVFFDFRGAALNEPSSIEHEYFWCLLPGLAENNAVVLKLSFDGFVKMASNRSQIIPFKEIINECIRLLRHQRAENRKRAEHEMSRQNMLRRPNWRGRRRRNIRL